jgi:ppGpp synthetase/RelA/SpoT-type nucleotidyltranferase
MNPERQKFDQRLDKQECVGSNIVDLSQRPPWSSNSLGRLGRAIRDDVDPPTGCPSYAHVMLWHSDLATEIEEQIENGNWAVAAELEATKARRIGADLRVTSRTKTIDTLTDKLRRRPNQQLNTVQDIAGVRIDADLLLSEQTQLAQEIAANFGETASIHDLRSGEHAGYRGVHVWLRLPAGRVEVQIRTILQSLWANIFEKFADTYGRGIRYGEPVTDLPPGTDPADVQKLIDVMAKGSVQTATVEAHWQKVSEIEDPGRRSMELSAIAMNKAFYFAGVSLLLKKEISLASFTRIFSRGQSADQQEGGG